ncbi:glycosyl transferase family 39, partial [Nonomuraea sp. NPDC005983]
LARLRTDVAVGIATAALVATLFAALAGPAAYAVTPLQSQVNGTNPTAGPATGRMGFGPGGQTRPAQAMGGERPGAMGPPLGQPPGERTDDRRSFPMGGGPGGRVSDALVAYLAANQGEATWLVAVSSAREASSVILSTGRPVIAMGGFTGSDPAMTVGRLTKLVASGSLRYVLPDTGRGGPGRGSTEVTTWVQANCKAVDGQDGLYDCSAG